MVLHTPLSNVRYFRTKTFVANSTFLMIPVRTYFQIQCFYFKLQTFSGPKHQDNTLGPTQKFGIPKTFNSLKTLTLINPRIFKPPQIHVIFTHIYSSLIKSKYTTKKVCTELHTNEIRCISSWCKPQKQQIKLIVSNRRRKKE
jgi:hypothetical protein